MLETHVLDTVRFPPPPLVFPMVNCGWLGRMGGLCKVIKLGSRDANWNVPGMPRAPHGREIQ